MQRGERQLALLGMVSESSLEALLMLCSERDSMLEDIVAYYGARQDAIA